MMEQHDAGRTSLAAEEAAEWFIRLKDTRPSRVQHQAYLRWLRASPHHMAEALRVGRMYGLLQHAQLTAAATEGLSNVIQLPAPGGQEAALAHVAPPQVAPRNSLAGLPKHIGCLKWMRKRWLRWLGGSLAAAVPVLLLVSLLPVVMPFDAAIDVHTAVGEWRQITLADGSQVRVGPHTQLGTDFDDRRRYLELAGGEGYFLVAKDPQRPFLVHAGQALVEAVGTQFGISRIDERVVVTVAEGSVAVSQMPASLARRLEGTFRLDDDAREPPETGSRGATPSASRSAPDEHPTDPAVSSGAASSGRVALSAGEQATIPVRGPVQVQRVNVAHELAWARGRLIFDSKTVAEAVAEFNRRNRLQILIDDPSLQVRAVRGVFDVADPESFAQFLASAARMIITREPRGVLRLSPASGTDSIAPPDINGPGMNDPDKDAPERNELSESDLTVAPAPRKHDPRITSASRPPEQPPGQPPEQRPE